MYRSRGARGLPNLPRCACADLARVIPGLSLVSTSGECQEWWQRNVSQVARFFRLRRALRQSGDEQENEFTGHNIYSSSNGTCPDTGFMFLRLFERDGLGRDAEECAPVPAGKLPFALSGN